MTVVPWYASVAPSLIFKPIDYFQNEETYGRLCFPFMFLHTTKNTNPQKGPSLAVSDSSLQDNAV